MADSSSLSLVKIKGSSLSTTMSSSSSSLRRYLMIVDLRDLALSCCWYSQVPLRCIASLKLFSFIRFFRSTLMRDFWLSTSFVSRWPVLWYKFYLFTRLWSFFPFYYSRRSRVLWGLSLDFIGIHLIWLVVWDIDRCFPIKIKKLTDRTDTYTKVTYVFPMEVHNLQLTHSTSNNTWDITHIRNHHFQNFRTLCKINLNLKALGWSPVLNSLSLWRWTRCVGRLVYISDVDQKWRAPE